MPCDQTGARTIVDRVPFPKPCPQGSTAQLLPGTTTRLPPDPAVRSMARHIARERADARRSLAWYGAASGRNGWPSGRPGNTTVKAIAVRSRIVTPAPPM